MAAEREIREQIQARHTTAIRKAKHTSCFLRSAKKVAAYSSCAASNAQQQERRSLLESSWRKVTTGASKWPWRPLVDGVGIDLEGPPNHEVRERACLWRVLARFCTATATIARREYQDIDCTADADGWTKEEDLFDDGLVGWSEVRRKEALLR